MVHPDDRERVVAADAGPAVLDIEYRMRGRDGAWLWIWEREVAVLDEGTQGVCFDITPLHETRAALDAARAQLAEVVNVAPVVLFATDPEGIITLSEGKALERLGLAPGELVGTSMFSYSDLPEFTACAQRALAGESFQSSRASPTTTRMTSRGMAARTAR
jgi:PAS domain-containing protein